MEDEDPEVRATLAALGVFELGVTLLSRTEPDHVPVDGTQIERQDASMPQAAYAASGPGYTSASRPLVGK
jgi:hypothetical protein